MTTFAAWLRKQRNRDDAIGDLACDALADPGWPRSIDLDEYERHLARHGVDTDVLRQAWAEWKGKE